MGDEWRIKQNKVLSRSVKYDHFLKLTVKLLTISANAPRKFYWIF